MSGVVDLLDWPSSRNDASALRALRRAWALREDLPVKGKPMIDSRHAKAIPTSKPDLPQQTPALDRREGSPGRSRNCGRRNDRLHSLRIGDGERSFGVAWLEHGWRFFGGPVVGGRRVVLELGGRRDGERWGVLWDARPEHRRDAPRSLDERRRGVKA